MLADELVAPSVKVGLTVAVELPKLLPSEKPPVVASGLTAPSNM